MRLIAGLSIAFLAGAISEAHADGEEGYEPRIIPQCQMFDVPSVGDVCGFVDIGEWKDVLYADAELFSSRQRLKIKVELIEALTLQADALEGQVDEYKTLNHLLLERHDELFGELVDMNRKFERERARPRIGSAVAWTVSAALGVFVLGYVGKDLL